MKKNWLMKAGSGLLMLALAMGGLTACGGAADLGKENVYSYQELALPDLGGDDMSIRGSYKKDDKAYLVVQVYHYNENSQTDYRLISMNLDGTGVESVQLLTPSVVAEADRADDSESGARDAAQSEIVEVVAVGRLEVGVPVPNVNASVADETAAEDADGADEDETAAGDADGSDEDETDAEESGETDMGVDEDFSVDVGVDSDYMASQVWEYTNLYNFTFGEDGIYSLKNYSYEDYSDPTNYISINTVYVCGWTYDGTFLWQTELEGMRTDEEYIYVNTMAEGPDGELELFMTGNSCYQQSVENDGTLGERKTLGEEVYDIFNYSSYLLPKGDGKLLALYYGEDYTKQYLVEYDIAKGTLGEPTAMPDAFSYGGYSSMSTGLNSDLIYTTSTGVFTYNRGDESGKEKLNFINSDLNITSFQSMVELNKNTLLGFFYENYTGEVKGGIFTYVPPSDIPDKEVLVLAGSYIGYDIRQRVVEFNRSSQEYRIVIKNYDSYNTYDDYRAGMNMLNNDIITGNTPDILIVEEGLPVNNYISKGLLADIGSMIENDPELSQVEFVQSVFDAYSVNGTLYQIIPDFAVRTMMAKTSLVGDRDGWTMNDMLQVLDTLPEGTVAIEDLTRAGFFSYIMTYCGNDFVDVDTGKCNFDTENFIAMMEFAKELPEEIFYDDDYWMNYNYESQFRENKTLLCPAYISRVRDLNYIMNGYFGEDVSFVGFPTESGKSGIVTASTSFAISAKSKNWEAAWQFLRYYLTDEYQDDVSYGLPVQMDAFMARAQEALERPYYMDMNGNKEEYDETIYINGEEIKLPPMTQKQVDRIVDYIFSVDKHIYYNTDILNIINEEMDAFYTGQKSAKEVAGIIQNRVQLFVDENS